MAIVQKNIVQIKGIDRYALRVEPGGIEFASDARIFSSKELRKTEFDINLPT